MPVKIADGFSVLYFFSNIPRKTTFEFYYIDYKSFVDVVKWKINAMNKMLDRDQRPMYEKEFIYLFSNSPTQ